MDKKKPLTIKYTIWQTILIVGGSIIVGMIVTHIAYYFALKGGI